LKLVKGQNSSNANTKRKPNIIIFCKTHYRHNHSGVARGWGEEASRVRAPARRSRGHDDTHKDLFWRLHNTDRKTGAEMSGDLFGDRNLLPEKQAKN